MLARCLGCAACLVLAVGGRAEGPAQSAPEQALQGFVDALRSFVVEAAPHPLYERSFDWGRQTRAFHRVDWHGLTPHIVKTMKNDGTWRKVRLDTREWPHSLETKVYEVRQVDPERMTFKLFIACRAGVEVEQQVWEKGLRIYSGSLKARFKFYAVLDCESTMTVQTKGFFPDFIFRLRVVKANCSYGEPVVEHFAGFGGTTAKVLGELVRDVTRQVRPELEERMLERVNQSIVRAADTKEVRLSLGKLVPKK